MIIDYYSKPGISNSVMKIFKESPMHYYLYLKGLYQQKDTEDKQFGRVIHTYFLEKHLLNDLFLFDDSFVSAGKYKKLVDFLISSHLKGRINLEEVTSDKLIEILKDYRLKEDFDMSHSVATIANGIIKDFYKYIEVKIKKNIAIVPNHFLDVCKAFEKNVREHKTANELLFKEDSSDYFSFNEIEVNWTNELGQTCKAKMDRVIFDVSKRTITVVEIKKTFNILSKFSYEANKYDYNRQMAFYTREALPNLILNNGIDIDINQWKVNDRTIVMRTEDIYPIKVFYYAEEELLNGQREYDFLLHEMKWHEDNNFWQKRTYKSSEEWIEEVRFKKNDNNDYNAEKGEVFHSN